MLSPSFIWKLWLGRPINSCSKRLAIPVGAGVGVADACSCSLLSCSSGMVGMVLSIETSASAVAGGARPGSRAGASEVKLPMASVPSSQSSTSCTEMWRICSFTSASMVLAVVVGGGGSVGGFSGCWESLMPLFIVKSRLDPNALLAALGQSCRAG